MYAPSLVAVSAIALFLNVGVTGALKADDAKNIQGTWKLVSLEGAEKATPEELKKLRVSITADRMIVKAEGKEVSTSPYKLNPSKNPKEIDLTLVVYMDQVIDQRKVAVKDKQTRLGIYELLDDDLKICVALTKRKLADPGPRPKELKGSGALTVMTLRREK